MTITNESMTKPQFTPVQSSVHVPNVLTTEDHAAGCEELIAGYRSMRAEAVKTYAAMLEPLNAKRSVIHEWRREDLSAMDAVISAASERLTTYRAEQEAARELKAVETLANAASIAEQKREEDVAFLLGAAHMLGDVDEAQDMRSAAEALRAAPPPVVAVFDDEPVPSKSKRVTERSTYSAKCVDVVKLAHAVATGAVSSDALKPNASWLNARARADREEFDVPGCEAQIKTTYAARRRHG